NSPIGFGDAFKHKASLLPYILLYADEAYRANHPLLSQLLAIEGNDASKLEYVPGYAHFPGAILDAVPRLNPTNTIMETQPYQDPLLYKLQQMLFIFEVGTAQ
ncbi:MAG: hypothetical protein NZP74_14680, partial [Anaerolineales bacterium]|nr:hypothetical protein [Anaerolineales bacterium]